MSTAPFRIGCDLVSLTRFRQRMAESESTFLERIFWPAERRGKMLERPDADPSGLAIRISSAQDGGMVGRP
jgi:phosphopantetheinyl transferase (holo-ACP synthase)